MLQQSPVVHVCVTAAAILDMKTWFAPEMLCFLLGSLVRNPKTTSSRNLSFRVEFCFANHNILYSYYEQHHDHRLINDIVFDQFLNVNDINERSLMLCFQINHVLSKSVGQD